MTMVKAALVQTAWTGSKDSMVERHLAHIDDAAKQGAQVICLQELFYGPYFCQVEDKEGYAYTERIPDGPTTKLLQERAKKHSMVIIAPMYEEDQPGIYYNTAAVIDADGKYLGKYRKTHIPHLPGFWEKFYFRPGNMGYPVFDTAVGKVGVYICYDRHFPEGARMLGLHGAELVFIPSATSRGLSMHRHDQPRRRRERVREERVLRLELLRRPARQDHRAGVRQGGAAARQRPRHGSRPRGARHLAVLSRPPARHVRGHRGPVREREARTNGDLRPVAP